MEYDIHIYPAVSDKNRTKNILDQNILWGVIFGMPT